jgi:hypothetical protein
MNVDGIVIQESAAEVATATATAAQAESAAEAAQNAAEGAVAAAHVASALAEGQAAEVIAENKTEMQELREKCLSLETTLAEMQANHATGIQAIQETLAAVRADLILLTPSPPLPEAEAPAEAAEPNVDAEGPSEAGTNPSPENPRRKRFRPI